MYLGTPTFLSADERNNTKSIDWDAVFSSFLHNPILRCTINFAQKSLKILKKITTRFKIISYYIRRNLLSDSSFLSYPVTRSLQRIN